MRQMQRLCLFNEENLCLEAAMQVRENAIRKREANMTAHSFCHQVNEELLPSSNLPPNLPRSIQLRTATKWLHQLSLRPTGHQKGKARMSMVMTGKMLVVEHRRYYLDTITKLRDSNLPPPPVSDDGIVTPPPDAKTRKKLVLIYHDESILTTTRARGGHGQLVRSLSSS